MFIASLLVAACGSTPATVMPATNLITGGASCPTAEKQDLAFSGRITGHVSCSTKAATCDYREVNLRAKLGLSVAVSALVGKQPVQLVMSLTVDKSGTYDVGPGGDTSTPPGEVNLDGMGHWDSLAGGSIVVSTDDPSGSAGTVKAQLRAQGDPQTLGVSRAWSCVKPPGSNS
jgi:hypothetical protein